MKKKTPSSDSAFLTPRAFVALSSLLFAFGLSLFAAGIFPDSSRRPEPQQDRPGTQKPEIKNVVGRGCQKRDLNALPYIPPTSKEEERRLTRHNWQMGQVKDTVAPNFLDMSAMLNQPGRG